MTDCIITREEDGREGRFVARVPGIDGEGFMTFTTRAGNTFSIDHTEVAESLSDMGVASALAKHVIGYARQTGQKIIPLCPYFRKYVERHAEEVADVIKQ